MQLARVPVMRSGSRSILIPYCKDWVIIATKISPVLLLLCLKRDRPS